MMNIECQKIKQYLYYGYVPPKRIPDWLDECFNYSSNTYDYKIPDVSQLFDRVMDEALGGTSGNGHCIIPLSGGWDSRILLGAALDRFETRQIKTISFGVPGQLDYDIGRLVAQSSGVEHIAVDLSTVDISWEKLIQSVEKSPWTYVPDSFYNRFGLQQASNKGDFILSGFMGDPLVGGHLSDATTRKDAIDQYLQKERQAKSISLVPVEFNVRKSIPALPKISKISPSELLDYGIRQANCIAPIVAHTEQMKGWQCQIGKMAEIGAEIIAPYIHPKWASYWIRAPKKVKKGQKLYLEMMSYKYPSLARLPSKYSFGAKSCSGIHYQILRIHVRIRNRLNRIAPKLKCGSPALLNYIDYDAAFRERDDYREVLKQTIKYLSDNKIAPWINFNLLKQQHMSFHANHADAFLVLIGLALNLAIENTIKPY